MSASIVRLSRHAHRASIALALIAAITLLALPIRTVAAQKSVTITAVSAHWPGFYDAADMPIMAVSVTVKNTWSTTVFTNKVSFDCGLWQKHDYVYDPDNDWYEDGGPVGCYPVTSQSLAPGQSVTLGLYLRPDPDDGAYTGTIRYIVQGWTSSNGWVGQPDTLLASVDMQNHTVTWLQPPRPTVGPKGASDTQASNAARSEAFTVTNQGGSSGTFSLSASCGSFTSCSVSPSSLTLGAGASGSAAVSYQVPPANGATSTISLTASYGSATDAGTVTVTAADQSAPSMSLSRSDGSSFTSGATLTSRSIAADACDADGSLTSLTVSVNGTSVSAASLTNGSASGCATTKHGAYTLPLNAGANTIVVASSDGVHSPSATYTVIYDETTDMTPLVSTTPTTRHLSEWSEYTQSVTITNPGPFATTYNIQVSGCGSNTLTDCSGPGPTYVPAGSTVTVTVGFTSGGTPGSATLVVNGIYAGNGHSASRSASIALVVDAPPVVFTTTTSPHGNSSVTRVANLNRSEGFSVYNGGNTAGVYTFTITCSGWVSGCPASPLTASIAPNTWLGVPVTYNPGPVGGSGVLKLIAQSPPDGNGIVHADTGWYSITAFDGIPPSVSISPAGSGEVDANGDPLPVYTTTRNTTFTVDVCDDASAGTPTLTNNGSPISPTSVATTTIAGCTTAKRATFAVTLASGYNDLAASASDGTNTGYAEVEFKYDDANDNAPSITAATGDAGPGQGTSATATFTVTNGGFKSNTYTLTAACTYSVGGGCSTTGNTTITLAAGASANVAIGYAASTTVGVTNTVTLTATYSSAYSSGTASRAFTSSSTAVDQFPPTVAFSLANNSTTTSRSLSITGCDPDGTVQTPSLTVNGNAVSGTATTITQAGCHSAIRVDYTNLPYALDANTLSAPVSDGSHTTTGTLALTYDGTLEEKPVLSTAITSRQVLGETVYTHAFTLSNPGRFRVQYAMTVAGCDDEDETSLIVSCGGPASVWLDAGASTTYNANFTTTDLAGNATLSVTASFTASGHTVSSSASVALSLPGSFIPALSPKTSTAAYGARFPVTYNITLANSGNVTGPMYLFPRCTNGWQCAPQSSYITATVPAGGSVVVPITVIPGPVGSTSTMTMDVFTSSDLTDEATVNLTAFDAIAPTVAITPATGAVTATRQVPISIASCDPDGTLRPTIVKVNGVVTTSNYLTTSPPFECNTSGLASLTATTQPGMNTIVALVSDGYHTTADSTTFRYDEVPEHAAVVTAGASTDLRAETVSGVEHFTVRNPGTLQETYAIAAACDAGVSGCTPSTSSVTIAPGATATIDVTFTTGATSAQSSVNLLVTLTGVFGNSMTTSASTVVQVDATAPSVVLSPSGTTTINAFPTISVTWCDAESGLPTHVVTIDGVALPANFSPASQAGCASAGTSSWTSASMSLGTHTITATASDAVGHVTSVSSTVTLVLPPIASFQPAVSPKSGGPAVLPHATATARFVIQNNGTLAATYHLAPLCSTTSCSVDRSTVAIAAGARDSVTVSFNTPGAQLDVSSTIPLGLVATYTDIVGRAIADTGAAVATIGSLRDLYQPVISDPYGVVIAVDTARIGQTFFNLANAGSARAMYALHVSAFAPWGVNWFQFWNLGDTLATLSPGQADQAYAQPISPRIVGSSGFLLATLTYVDPLEPDGPVLKASAVQQFQTQAFTRGVAVTPKGTTVALSSIPAQAGLPGAYTMLFGVRSTGTSGVNAKYAVSCGGFAANCMTTAGNTVIDSLQGIFNLGLANGPGGFKSMGVWFNRDPASAADSGWIHVSFTNADSPFNLLDQGTVTVRTSASYVAVAVSPSDRVETLNPGLSAVVERFWIHNTGTLPASFTYQAKCTGATSCDSTAHAVSPGVHDSTLVLLTLTTTGAPGDTGTVRLIATQSGAVGTPAQASGVIHVQLATVALVTVRSRDINPGANITRGQCLTISVGDDAAYECGDLRLVHALPATRTMNRAFAPALIYNSRHEQLPLVSADVQLAAGLCPSTIQARVLIPEHVGSKIHTYAWNRCDAHAPRRITIPIDSAGQLPTGLYAYTVQITAMLGDSAKIGVDSGTIAVVNRTTSAFGSGWWLDGVEQLLTVASSADQLFWVGGDGSTRLYQRSLTDTSVFVGTPNLARPDSIVHASDGYKRRLPNGAYVQFDGFMRHVQTVSRTGQTTQFFWTSSTLDSLSLPTASSSTHRTYTFSYAAGQLTSVVAPAGPNGARVTSIARTGSDLAITDPGAPAVHFTLGVGSITARTNRLNDPTAYSFDAATGFLVGATIDLSRTNPGQSIHNAFCPAEGAGLVACAGIPADSGTIATTWSGPRGAVTTFALTQYGAPTATTNAVGQRTVLERGDPRYPLLVTKSIAPSGFTTIATYDDRARVDTMVAISPYGDGANAITRYVWNTNLAFELVDSLVGPTGEVTTFGYWPNGDRQWQRDGRGAMSQTSFGYNANRQLESVRLAGNSTDERYYYNDLTGNIDSTANARGVVTKTHVDAIGRTDVVRSPIGGGLLRTQTFTFDLQDRVVSQVDSAPAVAYAVDGASGTSPAMTLIVSSQYDAESRVLAVHRSGTPRPSGAPTLTDSSTYDAAGRRTTAISPNSQQQSWSYDAAGNVTQWTSANGHTTVTTYDDLDRPIRRITPPTVTPGAVVGTTIVATQAVKFPYYTDVSAYDWQANDGSAPPNLAIPGDTATFRYDPATGGMIAANNSAARIARTYFPNGALHTDTTHIGTVDLKAGDAFSNHVYALKYQYDPSGRLVSRSDNLPAVYGCESCSQSFHYDRSTGLLDRTTDALGASFTFGYDAQGRLTNRTGFDPSSAPRTSESLTLDEIGRVTGRVVTGFGGNVFEDFLTYDDANRVTGTTVWSAVSASDSSRQAYNGLGALAAMSRNRGGSTLVDEYLSDAFGNQMRHDYRNVTDGPIYVSDTTEFVNEQQQHTRRRMVGWQSGMTMPPLAQALDTTDYSYDAAGNRTGSAQTRASYVNTDFYFHSIAGTEWTWNAYGGDEKLRVSQRSVWTPDNGQRNTFTEYRYDALGRRVLTRTRMDQHCDPNEQFDACPWGVYRSVWDGDQLLVEFRNKAVANAASTPCVLDDMHPTCRQDPPPPVWVEDSTQVENMFSNDSTAGWVRYMHAGGIDEPLAMWKNGWNEGLVPHRSWRGTYEAGTSLGAVQQGVAWPGRNLNAFHAMDDRLSTGVEPGAWLGTLVDGRSEPSGLVYMRNRYYDPKAGRFTQEDPIGLAGGMNRYGFASGDPINANDPFGLCPVVLFAIGPGGAALGGGWCLAEIAALAGAATAAHTRSHNNAEPVRIPYGEGNPEVQDHGTDATSGKGEVSGVVDRAGSKKRHADALRGTEPVKGKDRDVFPPAVIKPDATGVSVRPIDPTDNRAAGARLGNVLRGLPDGTPVILVIPPRATP